MTGVRAPRRHAARLPAVVALALSAIALAACGTTAPSVSPGVQTGGPTAGPSGASQPVRAYFILGSFQDNPGLVPVERPLGPGAGGAVERAAVMALLAGPNESELGARPAMVTSIPAGTRLLGLSVSGETATIDLSGEFFDAGAPGSVRSRSAQVVYTLTQFPGISSVVFKATGESFDRDALADQLPAIFVDGPAWGSVIPNPLHLTGNADVFEATFLVRLLTPDGRSLASGPVKATCGSGCRGRFDVTIPYAVNLPGAATLQVYNPSEVDGSPIELTEYPVTLTPTP